MKLEHLKVWLEEIQIAIEDAHETGCSYAVDYINRSDRYKYSLCDCRVEKAKGIIALVLNKIEKEIENDE